MILLIMKLNNKNDNGIKKKYEIKKLAVFDMFPGTAHIKTICYMVLKGYS